MQKSNAPTKLTVAFASGTGAGPVNVVPLTTSGTTGAASYQTGFTSVNMEPIASGGVPPFGADFNGIIQNATKAQIWQQSGFTWTFDSTFSGNANIGGYPAQSVLMMGSGNGLWINKTDNNTTNPDATGTSGWLGLPAVGAYTISTTGGTTTPSPSVLGVTTLLVTGALTSNATIVLPLTAGSRWIVANNTTGSYTLTVQGSSGAGVSITQGSALTVFTDGAAYYAASANLSGAYLPIDGTAVAATKLATARAFSITGLATAAAINFDGTGNVVFNVTALNVAGALGYTPANDASVVHIAGTETITGAKTFSQPVTISGAFTGASRVLASLTNTDTSTGSWAAINITSGAGGIFAITKYASTYSGTGFADAVAIDNSGTGGFIFRAGSGYTQVASLSAAGLFTSLTSNASSSDRRLKRNIRKFKPRPLHRTVPFVSYELKENGWHGLGSIAQAVNKTAPEYVDEFDWKGKKRLNLNYAGAAYEQAMWAGQEIDRLTKRIEKLERSRLPHKPGFLRRLREILW